MLRTMTMVMICVLLAGCSRNSKLTKANFDRITPGMTIAEVEAILGPGEQDGGDLAIAEGSGVAGAVGVGGDLQSMSQPRSQLKNYKWGNDKRSIKVAFLQGKVANANAKSSDGLN